MTMSELLRRSLSRVRLSTASTAETRGLAEAMARVTVAGDRIALVGPLGAGKTQFAKGFALGLGIEDVVNSPSYTLMSEYEGRLTLFHQDLYRLAGSDEVFSGGLLDERQDEGVTLIEWADRLDSTLDATRLTVDIEPRSESDRDVEISGHGAMADRYLEAVRRWQAARQ
ncbi:MAG: tRNA (adenosine(37)-N6)-threonylcarbamoyltransferase complex ATPase subunit type 1 TsaE [Chloroflexota bacterium]